MRIMLRHPSFKRRANRGAKPGTLEEAGKVALLSLPSAADPLNPGSVTQKIAITQKTASIRIKQNDPTSRTTIKRRPFHRSRRNPLYTLNTKMRFQEKFRGSQIQNSTLPVPMFFLPIPCLCHTDLEKAPSPRCAINSLAKCTTLTMKSRSASFRQANLPRQCQNLLFLKLLLQCLYRRRVKVYQTGRSW